MNSSRIVYWLAAIGLIVLNCPSVAAAPPQYGWTRAIKLPDMEQPTLLAIELDAAIYATQPRQDFADLRLQSDDGALVGFEVRQLRATTERIVHSTWATKTRGAKPLETGSLEVFVDNDDSSREPQGLLIVSPLRDFEHQVQVYSSANGQDWEPAGPPVLIFDYSRFVDVRNIRVPFDAAGRRQFRLVIDDVTAEQQARLMELTRRLSGDEETERSERVTIDRRPFRIAHTDFYRDDVESVAAGVRTMAYATKDFRVNQDSAKKQTLIEFSADGVPLTSITLLTDATNFSRAASLQESRGPSTRSAVRSGGGDVHAQDTSNWSTITSATVSRFSFEAIKKDDVTMRFPEQRDNKYRIVVENRDSPPLAINGVTVEGPIYQLVFMGTPGQSLRLDYGSTTGQRLDCDTAAVHKLLTAGQVPTVVALADPVENPIAVPAFRWANWFGDSRVLIGPFAVLIALLAWGLYRANQRLQTPPAS